MKRMVMDIDRLVLNGFRREDRDAIAKELQQELAHLLSAPGVPRHLRSTMGTERLEAKPVRIARGTQPGRIGAVTARSIVRECKS